MEQPEEDFFDTLPDKVCKGKYRFGNQRVLFTYKSHLPKEEYVKWLKEKAKFSGKSCVWICHEIGTNGKEQGEPYRHSHVVVDFGDRFQTENVRFFDYKSIHPHIKVITGTKAWVNACHYICKEDENCREEMADYLAEIGGPSFAQLVWSQKSLADAFDKCLKKDGSNAAAVKLIFENKPKPEKKVRGLIATKGPLPWQKTIMDIIDQPADLRTVHWIYDKDGTSGKSQLCMYLHQIDKALNIACAMDMKNFATNIEGALESGWDGKCITFDIARSERLDIYTVLEKIKDGMITSVKYKGKTSILDNDTHVFVFSNFLPNLPKLTMDRWKIFTLYHKDNKVEMGLLTLKEAQRLYREQQKSDLAFKEEDL